ncbi:hypothetical protein DFH07DRAFT_1058781 [Mycena maculata]|uniref:DUF4139 domain-containing protein n=1 Tax=Mycena maculata TaxID=230809 RepID=A0AAD7JJ08_9AGAR|nr:hypothetical protein DFH07DRAFT_1058781 [Mycena maculata]
MTTSLKLSAQENPIKAVTVYKSRNAEVVRIFSVDLQSGSNKIEITELPSCIDTHSVRVSGLGDARLFDVVCTARDKPRKSSEAVRLLTAKKVSLQGERRVRDHESDLLVTYAKTLSAEHVPPAQIGAVLQNFVDQGRKNIEAVAELDEKLVALDRQIEAERQKETIKKGASTGEVTVVVGTEAPAHVELKLTYIVTNASWDSTYELHAATENNKPSSSVSLHYRARIVQSTGEDWANTALTLSTVAASTVAKSIPSLNPVKIRPQTHGWKRPGGLFGKPAVNNSNSTSIFGRPNNEPVFGQTAFGQPPVPAPEPSFGVFGQATSGRAFGQPPAPSFGVFGQATSGTFGGASLFGQAPVMQAFGAAPVQQQQPQQAQAFGQNQAQQQPTGALFGQPAAFLAPEPEEETEDFEDIAIPGALAGPTTIVTETPLAISYAVEGATTVPSDGTVHQVSIAVLPFEAKISHICTPRVDPRVYLQCHVKNTSEYRLLPGPVSVVLNDGFVSKTSINEINTGDTFTCTLGDDVATKVTYSRSSNTVTAQGGSFQEVLNTTTYSTTVTIHNKHPFALADLVVRDVIPTCDDKRAKVLLRKPDGLAEAKAGDVVQLQPAGLKVRWGATADGHSGEKDGRFEWVWSVEAGAKAVLEAKWELKAPADVAWVESVSTV